MKKLLFQIGDVSQLAYAFQPVVQHQMVLSNTPDTTNPMQVPQIPIEPIDIVPIRDDDNTYESALYFARPEVADFVENTLENLPIGVEREQFLEAWKEKTNDFTTGKLTEQDIINSIGRENFKTKDWNLINSNIVNESKTVTKKEIKNSRSINKNKSNTSSIKSSNRDLVNSKKKQQVLITSNDWEKVKTSFFSKKEKLKNYIEYLEKVEQKNKTFNSVSIALTAVAWGLAAAYTAAAFWTFGATIPQAVSATIQATVSTIFLKMSIDEEKEVEKNLADIRGFYYSTELNIMTEFFNKKYKEIQDIFNKQNDNAEVIIDYLKNKFIYKPLIKGISDLFEKKAKNLIPIFQKNYVKFVNTIKNYKPTKFIRFVSAIQTLNKTFENLIAKSAEKKILMITTSILNPIGEFLEVLDNWISFLNLVATLTINLMYEEKQ